LESVAEDILDIALLIGPVQQLLERLAELRLRELQVANRRICIPKPRPFTTKKCAPFAFE
jgi:hypothetical protein